MSFLLVGPWLCITDINAYHKLHIFQHHMKKRKNFLFCMNFYGSYLLHEGDLRRKS